MILIQKVRLDNAQSQKTQIRLLRNSENGIWYSLAKGTRSRSTSWLKKFKMNYYQSHHQAFNYWRGFIQNVRKLWQSPQRTKTEAKEGHHGRRGTARLAVVRRSHRRKRKHSDIEYRRRIGVDGQFSRVKDDLRQAIVKFLTAYVHQSGKTEISRRMMMGNLMLATLEGKFGFQNVFG